MSTKLSAQMALQTCEKHPEDELDVYCKTCSKPICTECIKDNHLQHDWLKISKMARELKHQAKERKISITRKTKSFFLGMKKTVDQLKYRNNDNCSRCTDELEKVRTEMHTLIDGLVDAELSTCKDHKKKFTQKLQQMERDLLTKKKTVEGLIQNTTDGAHKYSDFDLVELHDELSAAMSELNSDTFSLEDWTDIRFSRGTIDKKKIAESIGSVSTLRQFDYTEIADFRVTEGKVNSLFPISPSQSWVHVTQTTNNTLYDVNAKMINTREIKCLIFNFTISEDGVMYYCDLDNHTINSVSPSGQYKILFSVKPLMPIRVSLTHAGDLLITMGDEVSYYRRSNSRRLVKRMTLTGDTIQEYEYEDGGTTAMLTYPIKAIENYNGDVLILDNFTNAADSICGAVIGFSDSRQIYRYVGQNEDYNPLDLCCDWLGNTITSDAYNRKLHVLNRKGQFLRYLLSDLTHKPFSVALIENALWIGSCDGYISVYEHKK